MEDTGTVIGMSNKVLVICKSKDIHASGLKLKLEKRTFVLCVGYI